MLLQDMVNAEEVCIQKYADYADRACDEALKTLFDSIRTAEQQHYDTLTEMQNGTIPQMNAGGKQQKNSTSCEQCAETAEVCEEDEYLCRDALDNEKHVSSLYDTCIFEFVSADARNVLNHIQKEEQEHGKRIYDYMAAHGMTA